MRSLSDLRPEDLGHAVEITDGVYWVGHHREGDPFQCHVYLIDAGDQSVLFDPGSNLTFDVTRRKIAEVMDFANIRYFVCHHQDPDITAALGSIDGMLTRDDAVVVTHWRAEMLLQHYGLRRLAFWRVEDHAWKLDVGGRRLRFVFTPYLHFPGAFTSFDEATGTLFSSDLFGGFSSRASLVAADESYFEDIRLFHEHYMPSRDILGHGLEKLEKLPLRLIAPQHGSLIPAPLIPFMINRLKALECGIYLLAERDTSLRKLVEVNRALHDLTRTMVSYRDFDGMVRELLTIFQRLLPVESLDIYVRGDAGSTLEFRESTSYRGVPGKMPEVVIRAVESAGQSGHVSLPPEGDTGPRLVIPLENHGYGSATAVLGLSRAPRNDEALSRIVEQINAPLSIAVEREWIQRQIEAERQELYERSIRDPLTHLFTRFHMNEVVARLIALHDRDAHAGFGVMMCDIDHFKRVNDTHGHLAGDRVLRDVGALLLAATRSSDFAVRFGGEEFAVFLVGTDDGSPAAERLRAQVEALRFDGDLAELRVTLSIGLARHQQGHSLEQLLASADAALYRAKSGGRNRVVAAAE